MSLFTIKVNFKVKTIARDKEGHYIIIKESILQDNNPECKCTERASKYTKQTISHNLSRNITHQMTIQTLLSGRPTVTTENRLVAAGLGVGVTIKA